MSEEAGVGVHPKPGAATGSFGAASPAASPPLHEGDGRHAGVHAPAATHRLRRTHQHNGHGGRDAVHPPRGLIANVVSPKGDRGRAFEATTERPSSVLEATARLGSVMRLPRTPTFVDEPGGSEGAMIYMSRLAGRYSERPAARTSHSGRHHGHHHAAHQGSHHSHSGGAGAGGEKGGHLATRLDSGEPASGARVSSASTDSSSSSDNSEADGDGDGDDGFGSRGGFPTSSLPYPGRESEELVRRLAVAREVHWREERDRRKKEAEWVREHSRLQAAAPWLSTLSFPVENVKTLGAHEFVSSAIFKGSKKDSRSSHHSRPGDSDASGEVLVWPSDGAVTSTGAESRAHALRLDGSSSSVTTAAPSPPLRIRVKKEVAWWETMADRHEVEAREAEEGLQERGSPIALPVFSRREADEGRRSESFSSPAVSRAPSPASQSRAALAGLGVVSEAVELLDAPPRGWNTWVPLPGPTVPSSTKEDAGLPHRRSRGSLSPPPREPAAVSVGRARSRSVGEEGVAAGFSPSGSPQVERAASFAPHRADSLSASPLLGLEDQPSIFNVSNLSLPDSFVLVGSGASEVADDEPPRRPPPFADGNAGVAAPDSILSITSFRSGHTLRVPRKASPLKPVRRDAALARPSLLEPIEVVVPSDPSPALAVPSTPAGLPLAAFHSPGSPLSPLRAPLASPSLRPLTSASSVLASTSSLLHTQFSSAVLDQGASFSSLDDATDPSALDPFNMFPLLRTRAGRRLLREGRARLA